MGSTVIQTAAIIITPASIIVVVIIIIITPTSTTSGTREPGAHGSVIFQTLFWLPITLMPCRVSQLDGVIQHIRITIERLWVGIARHNGIRAQEPSQLGRIETGLIVIDAQPCHLALPGVQLIG